MHEALATWIVDSTKPYRLLTRFLAPFALVWSTPLLMMLTFRKPGDLTPGDVLAGVGLAVVIVGVVILQVTFRQRRAREIAHVAGLLEHGGRARGRVVKADRVRGGFRLSVQMDAGPVPSFTTVVGAGRSAAFAGRPVEVAYERANPTTTVLVPDW